MECKNTWFSSLYFNQNKTSLKNKPITKRLVFYCRWKLVYNNLVCRHQEAVKSSSFKKNYEKFSKILMKTYEMEFFIK